MTHDQLNQLKEKLSHLHAKTATAVGFADESSEHFINDAGPGALGRDELSQTFVYLRGIANDATEIANWLQSAWLAENVGNG